MPQSLLDHLSTQPQLQALPNEQLEALVNQAELATASFGKSLINETDEARGIFVLIHSGSLTLQTFSRW